jgi:glycosyltransferase involved in cell wall biosynthesis
MYGAISNLAGKIHDFDYLVVPSRFEGLGLISIESSLSKVPVIAARAPGLDETLPADWPLFFDLEEPAELVEIFGKICESTFDREILKTTSSDFVSKKFSMQEMASAYSSIYLE